MSRSEPECRVCRDPEEKDDLLSPCQCDGSMKYIHRMCLNEWIWHCRSMTCPTCRNNYRVAESFFLKLCYLHFIEVILFVCKFFWHISVLTLFAIIVAPIGLKIFLLENAARSDVLHHASWWLENWPWVLGFFIEMAFITNERFKGDDFITLRVLTILLICMTIPVNLMLDWYYDLSLLWHQPSFLSAAMFIREILD